jgi:mono/diheme cytochrome c family protein
MIYRTNPINVRNIQLGWVLASRIGRVRLDGPAYREAISLDVPRLAVADPHGLALTPNEHRLAVTSSGTHELLVYRLQDLPFVGAGGPGDLIDPQLTRDDDLFYRLELGGRPMGLAARQDNKSLLCANYTLDTLQVIDIEARKVVHSIPLGTTPDNPSAREIHRGMEIFYDAERSLDQWYSCHSCHLDGGSNAKPMDTWNDGTELTPKTVIPLFGSTETAPWTWHGWQEDYVESLQNSFVTTMQGKSAPPEDLAALQAYLKQLEPSPNPFRRTSEVSQQAVARGRELFTSSEIGCADCHSGPSYTDGKIHDVGLSGESDKYDGFNTPSLINVYHKVRLLHDGRARTLKDVLSKWHKPEEIGGGGTLSPSQLDDLIQYLQTL